MDEAAPLATARAWVQRLGGRAVAGRDFAATGSMAVGQFRFDSLADEVEAPSLPLVYASVTLSGPYRMEARLGGARVEARVRPGQSVLMAAGRSNRWHWDRATEEAHVFLRPGFLEEAAAEIGDGRAEVIDRAGFDDLPLRQTVLAVADELHTAGGPAPLFLDMAAAALARHLLARHCDGRGLSLPATDGILTARQLRRVLALVEGRLDEAIGLDDLAAAAGVSRFHFARAFKAAVGESPYRWLTGLRVEKAKAVLAQTRLSLIEVAISVGFESQSHFGQVFRARTGLTPRDWRRRHQG